MTWDYSTEIVPDFWKNLFSQLRSFEAVDLRLPSGYVFRIPIEEAVLMNRLMPPTSPLFSVHIPSSQEGKEAIFHEPLGVIENQETDEIDWVSLRYKCVSLLSPLLGPSMQFLRQQFSEFFATTDKYLAVVETTKRQCGRYVREAFNALAQEGIQRGQSVVMSIDSGWRNHATPGVGLNRAYIPEPVLTFIAASYFRQRGFVTDTFREKLLKADAFPDLYAIRLPDVQRILAEAGIASGGFYLFELETGIKASGERQVVFSEGHPWAIVLEVESSRKAVANGHKQLKGYLGHGQFNEGYVVAPFVNTPSYEDVGLFTCRPAGEIEIRQGPQDYGRPPEPWKIFKEVERIVKLGLLKNLPIRKAINMLPSCNSYVDLHYRIDEVPLTDIIEWVTDEMRR